ncbi:hypothetical protein Bca4012_025604 [Brassica carinata]
MEFWGAEVKAGKPLKVKPDEDGLIHLSQASLDKGKKGETALLYVTVDGKKLVIGTLSQDNIPQTSFDLVFEKEFELSHSSEGSVHFIGYKSPNVDEEEDFPSDSEEEEEEVAAKHAAEVKPESDDDDDSDEEDDSEDDGSESEKGPEPSSSKKRPIESATPVSAKKAKPAVTPQKTEEKKKGGHAATPHPAKKGGKSPMNANQSPKSGGQSSGGNSTQASNLVPTTRAREKERAEPKRSGR